VAGEQQNGTDENQGNQDVDSAANQPADKAASQPAADETSVDFEAWLKQQPEHVQKAHAAHTAGLKSALEKERQRAAEAEKAKKAADSAAEQQRQKELEEQEKWKELAEERAAKLAELETATTERDELKAEREKLEALIAADVEAELKTLDLPAAYRTLLDKMTPLEKREWLTANRSELAKPARRGAPATPAAGRPKHEPDQELARREALAYKRMA
jgi:hypothetical protein